jgi:hypothetical protein
VITRGAKTYVEFTSCGTGRRDPIVVDSDVDAEVMVLVECPELGAAGDFNDRKIWTNVGLTNGEYNGIDVGSD